jgi:hypothetical protein
VSEDKADSLTNPLNKKKLMSRLDYTDLCNSIERIHNYLRNTMSIKSGDERENVCGLEKLLNSGHISYIQWRCYKAKYVR